MFDLYAPSEWELLLERAMLISRYSVNWYKSEPPAKHCYAVVLPFSLGFDNNERLKCHSIGDFDTANCDLY